MNDTETVCSYNGTFSISTVSVEKDLFSNALTIIFNIVPFIYTFQSVSATDFVSYNDTTFQNPSFTFENSQLKSTFTYSEDVQGKIAILLL